ncbi:MAG: FtsW/RodA/SpoVE family cell cycle protein [Acidobacteriota bacterium]
MFGITRRYLTDFDWPLLLMALMITAFGVLEISSAEPAPGLWKRQLTGVGIGLTMLFVVTMFDYRRIVNIAPYLYGVGVVLLALVMTPLGKEVNGNRSWLDFGHGIQFQPSEPTKIFTILFLAYYLAGVKKRPLNLRTLITAGIIWAVPVALVFAQHDTGSALSYTSFLMAMIFLAGVRWTWMVAALAVVVLAVVLVAPYAKKCPGYKCERIRAVYWPELADKRYRYQNEQSEIAVGSGGIFGKGFNQSTQAKGGFIPEVHNDFIFAVASEETGFVGGLVALTIYLLIVTRLIQIARVSRERVGLLLVGGFAALVLYHVAVNVGMVVRLLPIMGIPLPLMSYGGTSVIATLFGLGLAIGVRLRRFVN